MLNNTWLEHLNTEVYIYLQIKVYLDKTKWTLEWESNNSERFYLLIKFMKFVIKRFETPKFGL